MYQTSDRVPMRIHTDKGIIPIEKIIPTDRVYDFKTGALHEIRGIFHSDKQEVYQLEFTDGRKDYFRYEEPLFIGDQITNIKTIIKIMENAEADSPVSNWTLIGDLKQIPLEYHGREELLPDPYIAGALIIYGDSGSEYINLPLDRSKADQFFSAKYKLNHADKLGENTVFFRYDGTNGDELITWKAFFPNQTFLAKTKEPKDPIIPNAYLFASINDRWQFVRGAFDIGWSKEMFPKSCSIAHHQEWKLLALQELLLSLGVLSIVSYAPNLPLARGRKYRLDVLSPDNKWPGFFYNIDSIEKMILSKETEASFPYRLGIRSIKKHAVAYTEHLILEKPNLIYMTNDFLPRVSVDPGV